MMTKSIKQLIADMNASLDPLDDGDGIAYVYRLLNEDGECVYAGQTENLKQRIIQHLADGKRFCDVKFTKCLANDVNDAEALSIARYKPMANKTLPTNRFFVTYRSLCEEVSKVLMSDRVILETPSGAGKFRYIENDSANKILAGIEALVAACNDVADYDFDLAESLIAIGEEQ